MDSNEEEVFAEHVPPEKQSERRLKRLKKKRHQTTAKEEARFLFPQVLKIVVESEHCFLETKQLGQLLLLTSKSMAAWAFPEDAPHQHETEREAHAGTNNALWRRLCFSQWGKDNAVDLLKSMEPMAPEDCFRAIAVATRKEKDFKLRPLQYKPQDYLLIVTVHNVNVRDFTSKECVICKSIPGEDIPSFFENGKATVKFDHPLCEVGLGGQCWDTKVHIMRQPDQQVVQVASHRQDEVIDEQDGEYISRSGSGFYSYGPPMSAGYGKDMFSAHFRYWDCFRIVLDFDCQPIHGSVGIFGLTISALFVASEDWDATVEEGVVAETRAINEKKVTFAHFLEGVDAWDNS